ncbi:UNVERIFIED_CONTAM: hypothetical protein PYX00_011164 [Menopon gallinae]|uniref:Cytochrome d ubiquinol oxidase subunit II n=1 Tax=Menopon gallinae TaxID=328185 RepID=A0AAW2H635_9NEOP
MNHKWMFIAPILGIVFSFLSIILAKKRAFGKAFVCSAVSILGVVSTAGLGMFPFILPSISNPNASLTVWDSSSSLLTLKFMLVVTLIFLPIVLGYTIWVYTKLRGKIMATMFKSHFNDKIDAGY